MWRKGNPSALLVGMQTGAATVENSMECPQELKMELPFDPATPLLGLYPKYPNTLHFMRHFITDNIKYDSFQKSQEIADHFPPILFHFSELQRSPSVTEIGA